MSTAIAADVTAESTRVFPWGSNNPTRRQRVIVALCASALTMGGLLWHTHLHGTRRTDFGMIWFGARTMLAGSNPYELVGPGLPFHFGYPLLYPGPALVAGIPFAWLPEHAATIAFMGVSAFLFSYGITRHSWHLLPLFASEAFRYSVMRGQWTVILTAAVFLPWLACLVAVKPQTGIPVLASTSAGGLKAAAVGSLLLLLVSLALIPSWPMEWLTLVRGPTDHMRPRILATGGILVLLLLTRWRRPEAWLIITLACLPQTLAPYTLLMLLTVACTFREAATLVLISTIGSLADPYLVPDDVTVHELYRMLANVEVATGFLPATLLVMRRPNSGNGPAWLTAAGKLLAGRRPKERASPGQSGP